MIYFEYSDIENENIQGYFENMPFIIGVPTRYTIDTFGFNLHDCHKDFIPIWMKKINGYPLYFCIQIENFIKKEFKEVCAQHNIKYEDYNKLFKIIKIESEDQLKQFLTLALTIASMGLVVSWATKYNIFTDIENLAQTEIQIPEDQSFICIGHDCESLLISTNNHKFKSKREIINNFFDEYEYQVD
ncbi:hypothetical protein AAGS61_17635 [Lysinibacillus sp. KU-BSD001]|uniref:hypothetical protein n=1 Tax=Lysinibacillus sp. KU-BSD001 TaxID=3141328 RepID=UPI0036EBB9BE